MHRDPGTHKRQGMLARLRQFVRLGGDEFLYAFVSTSPGDARHRQMRIHEALAQGEVEASMSVGLAELSPDDSLEALIARGDSELYRARQARTPG